ncbi:MAG: DUF2764 family protein [Cyclobacteriaceae bacterium]
MNDYYYLLSAVPKLSLEEETYERVDFDQVFDLITENITVSDGHRLNYLLYQNDNLNLVSAIARQHRKTVPHHMFHYPSVFDQEVMKDYEKSYVLFPDYMYDFVEAHQDEFSGRSMTFIEQRLLTAFYGEVTRQEDDFLREYFTFERDLRNIITALNCRKYGYDREDQLIGDAFINQQLLRSSAADFGLGQEYPFVEKLQELIEAQQVPELEHFMDSLLWDHLDELTRFSYFNSHKLLAYTLKLFMVKKWSWLKPDKGKERLHHLIDNMMENFELPAL